MLPDTGIYQPPHINPLPDSVGSLKRSLAFIQNPLEGFGESIYREGLTQHRSLFVNMHVLTDPEGVSEVLVKRVRDFRKSKLNQRIIEPVTREGLITTHGDQWKCQRRAIAPIFRQRQMEGLSEQVLEAVASFIDIRHSRSDQTVDLKTTMSDLTFDVLARSLLGNPHGLEALKLREACDVAIETAGKLRLDDFLPLPNWFPRILSPRSYKAISLLRKTADRLLQEADRTDQPHTLIELLRHLHPRVGRKLNHREQIDNLIGFFIAGHESTAVALTWALYLISKHPTTQERIRAELDGLHSADQALVSYNDLQTLPFLRAVLNETMRLYPSFPIIGREAVNDTEILGRPIKRGETVVIPIYVMHRSSRYWENPNQFDPDRFIRNPQLEKRNPQYIPFGSGPRICIGASFAVTEAMLILANLLKQFEISDVMQETVNPMIAVSLRPDKEIRLRFTAYR